jgi:hypothetical protein
MFAGMRPFDVTSEREAQYAVILMRLTGEPRDWLLPCTIL